jgi:hypothetical protein
MTETKNIMPYAPVIIRLLKGVVYSDDTVTWNQVINYHVDIKRYLEVIGLELLIYESEGFAFVRQKDIGDDIKMKMPSLVEKRQLSYPVTLLCALLVERLYEFDAQSGDSTRLIISRNEIKEMVRIFLPDSTNETRIINSIDANINKLALDYGFLRPIDQTNDLFEVRRILKAKISADILSKMKEKLQEYVRTIS